jgi:hypothetical protein
VPANRMSVSGGGATGEVVRHLVIVNRREDRRRALQIHPGVGAECRVVDLGMLQAELLESLRIPGNGRRGSIGVDRVAMLDEEVQAPFIGVGNCRKGREVATPIAGDAEAQARMASRPAQGFRTGRSPKRPLRSLRGNSRSFPVPAR